jgi:hypothetical protein
MRNVPRCESCGLTVMTCPDLRWARYYGVYPLWMPKSMADRLHAAELSRTGQPDRALFREADEMSRRWSSLLVMDGVLEG